MTERPDTPDPSSQPKEARAARRRIESVRPTATTPRQRAEIESRRIRRTQARVETIPWYNNWRLLAPIVVVIILGIVLLGFALGQAGARQTAQPAAPAIQVTAGAPSIPVEVVTATPATAGGGTTPQAPAAGTTPQAPASTAAPKATP